MEGAGGSGRGCGVGKAANKRQVGFRLLSCDFHVGYNLMMLSHFYCDVFIYNDK